MAKWTIKKNIIKKYAKCVPFQQSLLKGWVTSGRWSMQRVSPSKWHRDLICRFSGEWLKILNLQPWRYPNTFSHMWHLQILPSKRGILFIYLFVIISFHQDPIEVGFLNKDWMLFFFNHSHNAQESESYFVILCLKNYDLKFCWCNLLAVVSNIAIANYFMQTSFFFCGEEHCMMTQDRDS